MAPTKRRSERERRLTAYHEAGHAVAALLLGLRTRRVHIVADGDTLGMHEGGGMPKWLPAESEYDVTPRAKDRLERLLIMTLAGPEAERRAGGRRNHVGASHDHAAVIEVASRLHAGRVLDAYIWYVTVRAECLFDRPGAWDAVEVIATALIERESLSGDDVRELYQSAIRALIERNRHHG